MNNEFKVGDIAFIDCRNYIYKKVTIIKKTATTVTTDYIVSSSTGDTLKFSLKTMEVSPKEKYPNRILRKYTEELNKLWKLETIALYIRPNTCISRGDKDVLILEKVIELIEKISPQILKQI